MRIMVISILMGLFLIVLHINRFSKNDFNNLLLCIEYGYVKVIKAKNGAEAEELDGIQGSEGSTDEDIKG